MPKTDQTVTSCPPDDDTRRAFKWLRIGILVMVFSAVLALLVMPLNGPGSFWPSLIYSESIGLSIYAIYRIMDWGIPLRRLPNLWAWAVAVIAVPFGYVGGDSIAAFLLGDPQPGIRLLHMSNFDLGLTIAASVSITYFFWSRERLHAESAARARIQRLAAETQLKLLQTQIEPHMLFNTLSTLHSLIELDPVRAQHMLDQLITYLRGTLSASRVNEVPLRQEFEQLRAYLQLMQVRMGARLQYQLDLPEILADAGIPPMLLQPLVENAIKHGLEPKVEGGAVMVQAHTLGGQLILEVSDTGLGTSAAAPVAGYGLTHVRERLEAVYGTAASLEVETAAPGFSVRITLPLSGGQR